MRCANVLKLPSTAFPPVRSAFKSKEAVDSLRASFAVALVHHELKMSSQRVAAASVRRGRGRRCHIRHIDYDFVPVSAERS